MFTVPLRFKQCNRQSKLHMQCWLHGSSHILHRVSGRYLQRCDWCQRLHTLPRGHAELTNGTLDVARLRMSSGIHVVWRGMLRLRARKIQDKHWDRAML